MVFCQCTHCVNVCQSCDRPQIFGMFTDFPIAIGIVSITDPDYCMWLIDGQLKKLVAKSHMLVREKKIVQTFFNLNLHRQIGGISELHGTD